MTETPGSSPYTDLDRPPLRAAVLRRALVSHEGPCSQLRIVERTGSTNADLATTAAGGAAEGTVLVAERQDAGRGRLGRTWSCPPRAGLHVSVLLRPGRGSTVLPALPPARYGWLPLLAGVALAGMVRRIGEVAAGLKWPNDLLVAPAGGTPADKCAGILAEGVPDPDADGPAVIVGIGLNVTLRADELPRADATSLRLAGAACTDRDTLLRALLRDLVAGYRDLRAAGGDPAVSGLLDRYRADCRTLGRQVRVELPNDTVLAGVASDVDSDGRLVVTAPGGAPMPVAAGDVVHVR